MGRNWRPHAYRSPTGILFMRNSAALGWAEMGFDEKYERDYKIFNPANQ